jgi:hypothetical protein
MLPLLQNHTKASGKVKLSFISPIKAFADDPVARIFNPAVAGRALILPSLMRYNAVHFIPRQRSREVVDRNLLDA